MRLEGPLHISYCTNIHPGSDWATTFKALEAYLPGIKAQVAPNQPMGLGLRLSDKASRELGEGPALEAFRTWLDARQIYVFTMNGFPYGDFHGSPVKDQVHHPDWTRPERLEYTLRLFRQLEQLMPAGEEAGISTSPVSYKYWHKDKAATASALGEGARQMARVAAYLAGREAATGNYLHLDVEPEPDGLLENTADVLRFYQDYLLPLGGPILEETLGIGPEEAREALLRHITLCYDICHFALAFEGPEKVLPALQAAGIRVGKIQVSAALKIPAGKDPMAALQALQAFNEPIYLHQVTRQTPSGVQTYPDLPELFREAPEFQELRAHFHVPVFTQTFGLLEATQPEILEVLQTLKASPFTRHLEVETYTWEVLPPGLKEDLGASIARELQWLKTALES
ncbi:metabolite traffic protein EboE [Robiginitalea sp. M366]|uniref:metabolite traffic protein EboE n=1 Tax=Robiginitalea aestuariiviva TaxID=3036903 RepID=UPI00240D51AD|nr:metabolite traffic protein EboE [Robiginitalea aestuariiviva]MDG1572615.1 metabolite traffic protein EboE [Robiginitalea aestuariiviva]